MLVELQQHVYNRFSRSRLQAALSCLAKHVLLSCRTHGTVLPATSTPACPADSRQAQRTCAVGSARGMAVPRPRGQPAVSAPPHPLPAGRSGCGSGSPRGD